MAAVRRLVALAPGSRGSGMTTAKISRRAPRASVVVSEEIEQEMLAYWLDAIGVDWCHPANETHAKPQYLRKRARLGVKAGVPDVLIFSPAPRAPRAHGVAIELKSEARTARVSEAQSGWIARLRADGWLAEVCKGAPAAITWLRSLGFGEARRIGHATNARGKATAPARAAGENHVGRGAGAAEPCGYRAGVQAVRGAANGARWMPRCGG